MGDVSSGGLVGGQNSEDVSGEMFVFTCPGRPGGYLTWLSLDVFTCPGHTGGYLTWWPFAGAMCFYVSRPPAGPSNMFAPRWTQVFSRIFALVRKGPMCFHVCSALGREGPMCFHACSALGRKGPTCFHACSAHALFLQIASLLWLEP